MPTMPTMNGSGAHQIIPSGPNPGTSGTRTSERTLPRSIVSSSERAPACAACDQRRTNPANDTPPRSMPGPWRCGRDVVATAGASSGGAAGARAITGAARSPRDAPHSPQNFLFAGFSAPQCAHRFSSAPPQSPQNFLPGGLALPQCEQVMSPSPRLGLLDHEWSGKSSSLSRASSQRGRGSG